MKPITDKELRFYILVLSTVLLLMIQLYVLGSKTDYALNLTYRGACDGIYAMLCVRWVMDKINLNTYG